MGVLVRDGKGRMTDGATCYRIPGYPDLRVEPFYDDPQDEYDGKRRRSHLCWWTVIDERFSFGLDRYRRWYVILFPTLAEIREWVEAGGPALWEPDRRQEDVHFSPIPPGMRRADAP